MENKPNFRLDNLQAEEGGIATIIADRHISGIMRSRTDYKDCNCDSERSCTCNTQCKCEDYKPCRHCFCDDDCSCENDCRSDCSCDNHDCPCESDCWCQSLLY